MRGRKRRAKTDRQDARRLTELLVEERLPEAWIAPEHIRQWRSRLHLRKALVGERTQWLLRIRSVLYHHGLSADAPGEISGPTGRAFLACLLLAADTLERIDVALGMVDTVERPNPRARARAGQDRVAPGRLPSPDDPIRCR